MPSKRRFASSKKSANFSIEYCCIREICCVTLREQHGIRQAIESFPRFVYQEFNLFSLLVISLDVQ